MLSCRFATFGARNDLPLIINANHLVAGAGLLAHVVEVLGIQYIILVSIVRTVTLMNGRSMETILRARSRSLPKRGNRQFTFGNPGEQ